MSGARPAPRRSGRGGPPEPFGRLVAERFGELAVPGLGFAVVEGDEVIEAAGLGVADASSGRPVTATTPFRVA